MLRKIFIGTVLLAAMMVVPGQAQTNSPSGYQSNTATADINAELSMPISIYSFSGGINFGGFMPGASEGTVVLPADPYGTRTATGGVTLVENHRGHAGRLDVGGEPNAGYQLMFTTDPVVLTGPSDATMTLTDITTFTDNSQFILDENGYQDVWFGGKLHVAAGQAIGGYYGTFQITASYL